MILNNLILKYFEGCELDTLSTLLECDFIDSHRHSIGAWSSNAKWIPKPYGMSWWSEDELSQLSKLVQKEKDVYHDPYTSWKNIPVDYLDRHWSGVSYLSAQSYQFYLASFIWQYCNNKSSLIDSNHAFNSWVSSLYPLDENFEIIPSVYEKYSEITLNQGRVVAYFLYNLLRDKEVDQGDKELISNSLVFFWSSWKYRASIRCVRDSNAPFSWSEYHAIGYDMQGLSKAQIEKIKAKLETAKAKIESKEQAQIATLTSHDVTGAMLQAVVQSYFVLNDTQDTDI